MVYNKVPFGYKDNTKVKPLCIMLSKISAYKRFWWKKKKIFSAKYDELLEKYHKTLDKVGNSMKERFDSEPDCKIDCKTSKNKNKILLTNN